MVSEEHEGLQAFEAPETDLAAQAPEVYPQVFDGLQVSIEDR